MKISNLSKSSKSWLIIAITIILLLILPIKIPYSIKTPGKIFPSKEWIIMKDIDGKVITILKDNIAGLNKNYSVIQFKRGDAIQFVLNDKVAIGEYVEKSDTIGAIYSNETEMQYAELMGNLAVAKASLTAGETGDKQTLIQEEKERLQYLKKKAEDQRNLFNRTEALFKRELISAEEYEVAKGNLNLCDLDVSISEAHLQTMQSGMKEEDLQYIRFQIKSLEKQLETIQSKFQGFRIVSQISGVVSKILGRDTLLVVSDISDFSIILPVKWEEKDLVKTNQNVSFTLTGLGKTENAFISRKEVSVHQINKQQVLFHIANLNSDSKDIVPGLIVECSIQCEPVSPFEFCKRMFNIYN